MNLTDRDRSPTQPGAIRDLFNKSLVTFPLSRMCGPVWSGHPLNQPWWVKTDSRLDQPEEDGRIRR